MQYFIRFSFSLFVTILVEFLFANSTTASAFTLSGTVTDDLGNAIPNTLVEVIDPSTRSTIQSTATSADGTYSTHVSEGTYNIQVNPPSASGFQSAIALMRHVTSDTVVNFMLVNSPTAVTLSGQVLGADGNNVPNQCVSLNTAAGAVPTDNSGVYAITVAPGEYPISVIPCASNDLNNVPNHYTISTTSPLSLTQNTTLDLQLPVTHVTVHVQDSDGLPVAGVQIGTDANPTISGLTIGGLPATGFSYYDQAGHLTNEQGEFSLWLFPTQDSGAAYTFIAYPPAGGIYASFALSGISVTKDQVVVIALQYLNPPSNETPVVNEITVTPNPVQISTSTTVTATFSDPDTADIHTAVWDWGDGSSAVAGTVSEANGVGTIIGTHTYSTAGVYTITLTVTDNQEAEDSKTATVTVYAVPTNNDQCKKGGWQNYLNLNFKNQGDCVSYVATHCKNPPAGN